MSMLVVMGSGETAPSLVKVHREVDLATPGEGPAVLLDTTFGFQVNADDLVEKHPVLLHRVRGAARRARLWRRADAPQVERERALALLGRARWAFAGPGSPTYTLRQWRGIGVPEPPSRTSPARGGTLVFGSAAACTLGTHAIPVYEIYKAGADPYWEPGLDLLGPLTGLAAVVVPHFDNAEGGRYDTRYCYLGQERLAELECDLPSDVGILGVDEHTALILDLAGRTARVAGTGSVTVRRWASPAASRRELGSGFGARRPAARRGRRRHHREVPPPRPPPAPAPGGGAAGSTATGQPSLRADADAAGSPSRRRSRGRTSTAASPRSSTSTPRSSRGARTPTRTTTSSTRAACCVRSSCGWATSPRSASGTRGRSWAPTSRRCSRCGREHGRPGTTRSPTSSATGWGGRCGGPRHPRGGAVGSRRRRWVADVPGGQVCSVHVRVPRQHVLPMATRSRITTGGDRDARTHAGPAAVRRAGG